MNKIIYYSLLLTLSLLCTSCSNLDDPRLRGTWRSSVEENLEAYYQAFPNRKNEIPERTKMIEDVFSPMIHTWDKGTLTTEYKGQKDTFKFQFLEVADDYVIVKIENNNQTPVTKLKYTTDKKSYYIVRERPFLEKYNRVN